jgi:diaminopimelate epimerase
MHGLGNDYVVIDGINQAFAPDLMTGLGRSFWGSVP